MEKAAGDNTRHKRPTRNPKPTATLLEHSEGAALPSQQKKINEYLAAEAAKRVQRENIPTAAASSTATTPAPDDNPSPSPSFSPEDRESSPDIRKTRGPSSGKRKAVASDHEEIEDDGDEIEEVSGPVLAGKSKRPHYEPDIVDSNGFLEDINVQSVKDSGVSREDKSRDIDEFFEEPVDYIGTNGATKKHRRCKTCPGKKTMLVNEATTLRRHCEAKHSRTYREWASKAKFESKLPGDVNARKKKIEKDQRTLDASLIERKLERVVPYTHKLFRKAAVDWLVATDQPIRAFEHPKFKDMIDTAARATNGVKIPGRKATRAEIMRTFKTYLTDLSKLLNSPAVSGTVNITFDAWQAGNSDGYFAVTGHWIQEDKPREWELKSALLGFTMVNNAHHGVRLGQILFKITERVDISHKIGHATCDSASNNGTTMQEFSRCYEAKYKEDFPWEERKLGCLGHVINLPTQLLISTYSKSPHYDPLKPDTHIPSTSEFGGRDEIGLVRTIAVKEHSSAQRKQLFHTIQARNDVRIPKQLLIDMKVRWSSTHSMLVRAENLRTYVDLFVYEMGHREKDLAKRRKLDQLLLSDAEWTNVGLFLNLLGYADRAQLAFSSETGTTLHKAIPALESLHKNWTDRAAKDKYKRFQPALNAAIGKVEEYYDKTANSDAYNMSMLLSPTQKMAYFEKNWSPELQKSVLECAEAVFKKRWLKMNGNGTSTAPRQLPKKADRGGRRNAGSSDEDEMDESPSVASSSVPSDPLRPWYRDFRIYIDTRESELPEGMGLIQWWGQNAHRYPVWASLARDYLAIMASSVSSERAFSQGGITVSKRRSRLKGDIVEALQVYKCSLRNHLIFREPGPSSNTEFEPTDVYGVYDNVDEDPSQAAEDDGEEESWDTLLLDDGDDEDIDQDMIC